MYDCNVSSGVGQTEVSGGSLPPAMMIQRPELPAPKLTIRREPEGVKIFEGRARLLVGLEPSVASNLCVLCHFQGVIHLNSKVPHGALDLGMAK